MPRPSGEGFSTWAASAPEPVPSRPLVGTRSGCHDLGTRPTVAKRAHQRGRDFIDKAAGWRSVDLTTVTVRLWKKLALFRERHVLSS